jgi:DHA1 family multidrug resistance protein-like MFS transporter
MSTQFRDTQSAHLVRFLSRHKFFRYPDEIDPSLWRKSSTPTRLGEQNNRLKNSENPNASANASAKDVDMQDVDLQDPNLNRAVEDGKDIYLVDWYGAHDPEVSAPIRFKRQAFLTRIPESAELA